MPMARYTRVDGKKSFNYCSAVSVVVFVALCLVGVWIFTSSSSPSQNVDVPQENQKTEVKQEAVKENSERKTKQFEDSNGDLPDDATKGDSNVSGSQDDKNNNENTSSEDKQKEKTDEVPSGENESDDTNKRDVESEDKKEDELEYKKEDGTEDTKKEGDGDDSSGKKESEDGSDESKPESDENEKSDEKVDETNDEKKEEGGEEEKVEENQDKESDDNNGKEDAKTKDQGSEEVYPSGVQSDLLNETSTQNGAFSTQADESKKEKEAQTSSESKQQVEFSWKLCNTTAGTDYIPCLDNWDAIHHLLDTMHYEHRERHCPSESPTCIVPLPEGYMPSIEWPKSRDKIWYYNVPHTKLAKIKGHQNWVKVTGEYLTFPGGGTQFKNGALHYIEVIENMLPAVAWGRRSRVVLDVGCGVASFGGFLFDKDVLTMSFAPKDEHEAQTQFALERGIPAISAVMGTERLPFPGIAYDVVHCARCRVPWHVEGGKLLLELNRVLRPGGFFIWSATPVYQTLDVDVEIWNAMSKLTEQMCWKLVKKENDTLNQVGIAIYQKPSTNECYDQRSENEPPLCEQSDDRNAAWSVPLQACMHRVPEAELERGSKWPEQWSARLEKPPYWLTSAQVGVYGKPAPEDFSVDYEHWKNVVNKSYLKGMGISWKNVRNVMDMQAVYGGFAAALKDLQVWVMNVVSVNAPDTLPVIYERGLFGVYHNWCESFNTYPRSYDLLHADHLFSKIKTKCNMTGLVVEVDRILRPEGKLIVRDSVEIINELETMLKSMNWKIRMTYSKNGEGLLCAQKTTWRPQEVETLKYALQ